MEQWPRIEFYTDHLSPSHLFNFEDQLIQDLIKDF